MGRNRSPKDKIKPCPSPPPPPSTQIVEQNKSETSETTNDGIGAFIIGAVIGSLIG